ncbi:MAG: 3'(2'),5'-bisphosphate nucleotidase CysQ [Pseudomonadota bacterium]
MDYERFAEVIEQLARQAGAAIMEIYQSEDFGVEAKSDDSPVTKADKAADAIILAGLKSAFPDVLIVTEEEAGTHSQTAASFIIVDPLDGTKEFINRRGEFTVNIALVENGTPTRGVVYAPALDRMFLTTAEGKAVEIVGGESKPLSVATPDPSALRVVASKSHRDAATDAYISQYSVGDLKSAGSSLKFCLLATGEADLYPRLGRTMEWDIAAGHAVLSAAGGDVVSFEDHGKMPYGKPGYANGFFIAFVPGVNLAPASN